MGSGTVSTILPIDKDAVKKEKNKRNYCAIVISYHNRSFRKFFNFEHFIALSVNVF